MPILRRTRPEVELLLGDLRLNVDLRDHVIGSILYLEGEFEPKLQELMRHLNLQGSVCVDVGANIGLHTILLSRLVGPSGKVFAFEPERQNFELLLRNLESNHADNVIALQAAVGDRPGTCRMALNPINHGDHRVCGSSANDRGPEVPVVTIDRALRGYPDGAVKFIKVDAQGYEHRILNGMGWTLRRNPGAILAIEVFPEGLREAGSCATALLEELYRFGFTGWELHDFRIVPLSEAWTYDLIRSGKAVDIVVSRQVEQLNSAFSAIYGRPLRGPTKSRDGDGASTAVERNQEIL